MEQYPARGGASPHRGVFGSLTRRHLFELTAMGLVSGAPGMAHAAAVPGQLTYAVHISLAPTWFGFSGWVYGGAAVALNLVFTALAARLLVDRRDQAARTMFLFSLLYLFLLFAFLIVDRAVA